MLVNGQPLEDVVTPPYDLFFLLLGLMISFILSFFLWKYQNNKRLEAEREEKVKKYYEDLEIIDS